MHRLREAYLAWSAVLPHIAKSARYGIGARIDNRFLSLLERTHVTYFSARALRGEKIANCIVELDTLKFLLATAWEAKHISNHQYELVALKLEEVGKMFGGWKKSLATSNKNRTLW
ncbi:MAG: four helix bundle protein [Candidatus Andersenbacteria bacterium]